MRVLGIDPGSRATGWGLVGGDASRPRIVDSGTIRLDTRSDLPDRLHALQEELGELIARLEPGAAAVETAFHGASARSALQLAHARGVILAALAGAGVPVFEYTPATVKQTVAGNGRARKEQVQAMVHRRLRAEVRGADRADALAVALCHLTRRRFHEAVARATTRDERIRSPGARKP